MRRATQPMLALAWMLAALTGTFAHATAGAPGGQSTLPSAAKSPAKSPASSADKTLAQSRETLSERERGAIHPGPALVIVGREQGDNDLRSNTPALARSDRLLPQVSEEDNHSRALAMYGEGAQFHSAVPLNGAPSTRGEAESAPAPVQSAEPESLSQSGQWPWAIGIATSALLCLWIQRRYGLPFLERPAGKA